MEREREKRKKKSERTSEEKEKIENETKCFENLTVISLVNSKECRRGGEERDREWNKGWNKG